MSHPSAWTEIKITVALGPLDLCTVIGEIDAHGMNTCKARAPRRTEVRLESCLIMLGLTLPKGTDLQTPLGPSLNDKNLPSTTPCPDKGVG